MILIQLLIVIALLFAVYRTIDLNNFQITVFNIKDKAGNLMSADKNKFNLQTIFIENSSAVIDIR